MITLAIVQLMRLLCGSYSNSSTANPIFTGEKQGLMVNIAEMKISITRVVINVAIQIYIGNFKLKYHIINLYLGR